MTYFASSNREEFSSPSGNLIVWEDCRTDRSSTTASESSLQPPISVSAKVLRSASLADRSTRLSPRVSKAEPRGADKTITGASEYQDEIFLAEPADHQNRSASPVMARHRVASPRPARQYGSSSRGLRQPASSSRTIVIDDQRTRAETNAGAGAGGPRAAPAPPPGGWPKALQQVAEAGLRRFTKAQITLHSRAVREIFAGKKSSCWMWFCFPTPPYIVNGQEMGSARNRMYAIRTDEEAREFLTFEADGVNLRDNYFEVCSATRDQVRAGITAKAIFGFIDEPKLRSSVKYFERISRHGVDERLNALLVELLKLLREPADMAMEASQFHSTAPQSSKLRPSERIPRIPRQSASHSPRRSGRADEGESLSATSSSTLRATTPPRVRNAPAAQRSSQTAKQGKSSSQKLNSAPEVSRNSGKNGIRSAPKPVGNLTRRELLRMQ